MLATACAGQAQLEPPPDAPPSHITTKAPEQDEVRTKEADEQGPTVSSLERDLERAESELNDLVAVGATPGDSFEAETNQTTGGVRTPTPASKPASPCQRACAALASMRRSAEGICRLAQEEPERCERAKASVDSAARRVGNAGCRCEDGVD